MIVSVLVLGIDKFCSRNNYKQNVTTTTNIAVKITIKKLLQLL